MKVLERKPTTRVTLRRWPVPYRAALAICNDIDGTTWSDFVALHRFLNTTQSTPLGDGLGLPVGNSYWMYTVRPDNDPGFAYFDDLDGRPSAFAPRMREWMRAGLLDVLHTYGNFSQHGGFRRVHAERAAAELTRHHVRPAVWVNHGDVHNFQNIHGPGGERTSLGGRAYHRGADGVPVRTVEYHLDITHELGIRFLWTGELTQDIGQDRPLSAREHLFATHPIKPKPWLRRDLPALGRAWASRDGTPSRGMHDNRLLRLHPLDPGPFYRFVRFGRYGPDRMDHVPILLAGRSLDGLADSGGAMVLFVHLGKRVDPGGPVLSAETMQGLRGLARRYHDQQLYVQTTSRLLRYIVVRDHLRYAAAPAGDHTVLDIQGVDDPVLGRFVPTADDLAGVCFEVGGRAVPRVTVAGRPADQARIRRHGDGFVVQFPPPYPDVGDLLDE